MSAERRGFTLIEALVAVLVVALLLAPTLRAVVASVDVARASSRQLALRLVLERQLASLPLGKGAPLRSRSTRDGGFAVRVDVEPIRQLPPPPDSPPPSFVPYRITIAAVGPAGTNGVVETVRLAPP